MATFEKQQKKMEHLMRLLKVNQLALPVFSTPLGPLEVRFTKDSIDFEVLLDAVPIDMEQDRNKELKERLRRDLFDNE